MKRYLKNFDLSEEFVRNCLFDCLGGSPTRKSRWKEKKTIFFLAEYLMKWEYLHNFQEISNIKTIAYRLYNYAINDKEKLYPIVNYAAHEMFLEIKNRSIRLKKINYNTIIDKGSKKTRIIGSASMKQQCYDYVVVNALKDMFNAKIGHYQCASLPRKGQLFGKQAIETWIRTNPKKCKWFFKADVKQFFPSVNHSIAKRLLKRDIKNKDILYLAYTLIDTYGEVGLCIGSYFCQYMANYIMSYPYHYVTEMLYLIRRGKRYNLIHHTLFYMDDIILIGSNKKHVKKAAIELEKYLSKFFYLKLKLDYQLFPIDSRPIDMMGYKIYSDHTTIRKRIFKPANRLFSKVKGKDTMTLKEAQALASYYGYFKYTNSYKYKKKVKMNRSIRVAKEVISNEAKKSRVPNTTGTLSISTAE